MTVKRIQHRLIVLILKMIQWQRILFWRIFSTAKMQGDPRVAQPVQCVGKGQILVHDDVQIGVWPSPFFLSGYSYIEARHPQTLVEIGKGTIINNNFVCIAERTSIKIGSNVLIGTNVEMLDSDFHGLHPDERNTVSAVQYSPVQIGNNVFIGSNVRILKGVIVGDNAVIANSSVVTKDVPENSVVAGVPAREIIKVDRCAKMSR